MKKIVCKIKGHRLGEIEYRPWNKSWHVKCKRCGYEIEYKSPHARLVGTEMRFGFDGE